MSAVIHSDVGSPPDSATPANPTSIVENIPQQDEHRDPPDLQPDLPGPSSNEPSDNRMQDEDAVPVAVGEDPSPLTNAGKDTGENGHTLADRKGLFGWLERRTGIQGAYLWLMANAIVSFLWGCALATFAAGVVPWAWTLSEFAKQFDSDWTNEAVALIGSICTLHVTYLLQLVLKEYSYIMLAGEFTLKDLKCLQGVNEISLFAEFPARRGAPPPVEGARGPKSWWGSVCRFCNTMRFAWYIVYLGVALHTTSIVSILQPGEHKDAGLYS